MGQEPETLKGCSPAIDLSQQSPVQAGGTVGKQMLRQRQRLGGRRRPERQHTAGILPATTCQEPVPPTRAINGSTAVPLPRVLPTSQSVHLPLTSVPSPAPCLGASLPRGHGPGEDQDQASTGPNGSGED
jgi:hypothetical protein